MKVLDVMGLRKGIRDSESGLHRLEQQVKEIRQRVGAVVGLDDAFQGKGAQAIRSFYEELHLPFLLFLEGFIADYQDVLKEMDSALQSLESDEDGYIHQEFLEDDLVAGLKKAERVTMSLTDETNAVIKSVKDIVSLPLLDDEEFLLTVTEGRSQIYDTVEQLHHYDSEQSGKLENVEHDVQLMKQYLEKINEKRVSGELNVSTYAVKQLSGTEAYDELLEGLKSKGIENATSMDNVLAFGAKEFLIRFLDMPIPNFAVKYIQEKFDMRTMDYSVRAMKALSNVRSNSITAEEFTTLENDVVKTEQVSDYKGEQQGKYMTLMDGRILRKFERNEETHYRFVDHIPEDREEPKKVNPFVKAGNSLWEIGKDIKQGYEARAEKRHDSWYDYANYWSSGLLDVGKGMGEGLETRANKAFESPSFYNVTNWLSMGSVDLVNGAVNPDDALSKAHLTANLGLVGLLGVVKGAAPTAGGSNAVKSASQSAKTKKKAGSEKQEGKSSAKSTSKPANSPIKGNTFRPVLIPSVNNLVNNFKKNMPEVKVFEDSAGGYHFSVRKGEGGNIDKNNADRPVSFRVINGFEAKPHPGKQGKHIPGHPNYQVGKSIFTGDAQQLLDQKAGTGQWLGTNKERVDFGETIGEFVDPVTGEFHETTKGIIHYSKNGAHIVPSNPISW